MGEDTPASSGPSGQNNIMYTLMASYKTFGFIVNIVTQLHLATDGGRHPDRHWPFWVEPNYVHSNGLMQGMSAVLLTLWPSYSFVQMGEGTPASNDPSGQNQIMYTLMA